jgi:hypothetical protein
VDTFFHYDQALDSDNIESACICAVKGSPMVPMALFPMDGSQWLIDLIDALKGHKLESTLNDVMELIFRRSTAMDMEVLASVVEYRPEHFNNEQILIMLEMLPEMSDKSKSSLARALCTSLLDRGMIYDFRIRSFASQSCTLHWLASAYVCLDHSWTLSSLRSWFDGDSVNDEILLSRMCMRLTLGELIELEKEIKYLPFQATTKVIISNYFTRVSTLKTFTERGLSIRWK